MAIVIQEENREIRKYNLMRSATLIFVFAVVLWAVYYIFFVQPELLTTSSLPPNFQNTAQLSGITIDSAAIVNSPEFQSLKEYVSPLPPAVSGRDNPFLPL